MLGLLCTLCLPVCLTRSIQRIGHKYPTPGHNPYTPYSQHPDQQYSVLGTGVPGHIPADVLCRNPTLHHKREQETSPNPHKNNIVIFLSSGTCIPIRAKSAEKPSYSPETSPQSVFSAANDRPPISHLRRPEVEPVRGINCFSHHLYRHLTHSDLEREAYRDTAKWEVGNSPARMSPATIPKTPAGSLSTGKLTMSPNSCRVSHQPPDRSIGYCSG